MTSTTGRQWTRLLSLVVSVFLLLGLVQASPGDRLPAFKECLEVCDYPRCAVSDLY